MMRVQIFPCSLAKADADALNRESGRVYTNMLVWHYRIYRRTGHWLSEHAAKRLEDYLGSATILHAHSRDAAQEGFYNACKVAKSQRADGDGQALSTPAPLLPYNHLEEHRKPCAGRRTAIGLRPWAGADSCAVAGQSQGLSRRCIQANRIGLGPRRQTLLLACHVGGRG
jgi:hypothetical protein